MPHTHKIESYIIDTRTHAAVTRALGGGLGAGEPERRIGDGLAGVHHLLPDPRNQTPSHEPDSWPVGELILVTGAANRGCST